MLMLEGVTDVNVGLCKKCIWDSQAELLKWVKAILRTADSSQHQHTGIEVQLKQSLTYD